MRPAVWGSNIGNSWRTTDDIHGQGKKKKYIYHFFIIQEHWILDITSLCNNFLQSCVYIVEKVCNLKLRDQ